MPLATIIHLIIIILVIAIAVWGAERVCTSFKMPTPVFWVVGAILLIVLLLFVMSETGLYQGGLLK